MRITINTVNTYFIHLKASKWAPITLLKGEVFHRPCLLVDISVFLFHAVFLCEVRTQVFFTLYLIILCCKYYSGYSPDMDM